jgi:hypothetical protein
MNFRKVDSNKASRIQMSRERLGQSGNKSFSLVFDSTWLEAVKARLATDSSSILVAIMLILFVLLYIRGITLGLDHGSAGRVSIHAVPVAMAPLYHGLPHDYTSRKAFALAFQDQNLTFEQKVHAALGAQIDETSEKYYWAADDRGMADFVIGAFKIFGPKERSLYRFYFLILAISICTYVAAYYRNPPVLTLGVLILIGIGAFQSILPLVDEATFLATIHADKRVAPVGMFEPRALDVLVMLAVVHIMLFAWRIERFGVLALVTLAVQVLIFVMAYHARSSLGWQVLAMLIFTAVSLACLLNRRTPSFNRLRRAVAIVIPLIMLAGGLAALNIYKKQVYDPKYFAEMGSRTFWHNALMGLSSSSYLGKKYGLGVDDRMIVEAVVAHAKHKSETPLDATWNAQKILESLGGHGVFDWKAYEAHAKSLYFEIVFSNKRRVLATYVVRKPRESLSVVRRAMQEHHDPVIARVQNERGLYFDPLAWPMVGFGLLALLLAFGKICSSRDILACVGILGICSLIPSVAFYSATLTLGGFFISLSIATFLAICMAAKFVGKRYLRPV